MKKKSLINISILTIIIIIIITNITIFLKKEFKIINKDNTIKNYQDITTITNNYQKITITDYQQLYSNSDIIGELIILNTNLKVPVVKSNNNFYYLNHSLRKTSDPLGSIFMDYRNQPTDKKIIIYGHNSHNIKTEFNLLENYLELRYYQNHNMIIFKSVNKTYYYRIFSIYIATSDYQHVNLNMNTNEYHNHINWLKEQSLYDTGITVNQNDDILLLQTCLIGKKGSYIIICSKKIETIDSSF